VSDQGFLNSHVKFKEMQPLLKKAKKESEAPAVVVSAYRGSSSRQESSPSDGESCSECVLRAI
jgi:hypothetical protein